MWQPSSRDEGDFHHISDTSYYYPNYPPPPSSGPNNQFNPNYQQYSSAYTPENYQSNYNQSNTEQFGDYNFGGKDTPFGRDQESGVVVMFREKINAWSAAAPKSREQLLDDMRSSRRLIIFIVFIALLLDNMLLTSVVPIIPDYLYKLEHPDGDHSHKPSSGHYGLPSRALSTLSNHSNEYDGLATILAEEVNFISPDDSSSPVQKSSLMSRAARSAARPSNTSNTFGEKYSASMLYARQLNKENVKVGLMFASKALVQLFANPFVGVLTNYIGFSIPMFVGFVILILSTVMFAFGESYGVLVFARSLQGIGSSCSSVAGMGMLAEKFPDDEERGNAMGIALGGLAMGVLIGPPFGGFMYQFVGKPAPFLVLAVVALLDGTLQLIVLRPGMAHETQPQGTPLNVLLRDPYILIAAGSITFANMAIALLEPTLPIWMMENMNSEKWQLGAIWLGPSCSYLIATYLWGFLGTKLGRWVSSLVGMVIVGVCMFLYPFATSINGLVIPGFGLGFAIGMVDASMMPMMGYLVDLRYVSVYGSVYAIADVAFCVGYAVGPALSGYIVEGIGFPWLVRCIAIVNIIFAPLLYYLKRPPSGDEETRAILKNGDVLSMNKGTDGENQVGMGMGGSSLKMPAGGYQRADGYSNLSDDY